MSKSGELFPSFNHCGIYIAMFMLLMGRYNDVLAYPT